MNKHSMKKIKAGAAGIASTTRGRARTFEDKTEPEDETQDLIEEGLAEYEEKKARSKWIDD